MKEQKGFTLVELLAVIVILAVIALIATPQILRLIENSRKEAFKDTAYGIIQSAEQTYTKNAVKQPGEEIEYKFPSGSNLSKLDIKGDLPKGGYLKVSSNGQMELIIHNGKYCAKKEKGTDEITVSKYDKNTCKTSYQEPILNGADPELQSGMIPINYQNNKPVKADITKEWYSYADKEWANVVLVKEDKRETYQQANGGTEIVSSDILGYLVWIPRFKYQLFNVAGTVSTTPSTINIIFENAGTSPSRGTNNGEYYTPRGFTFGGKELNGYWIGKFETTGTAGQPTILPNVSSLRAQNISTQFDMSRKFNQTNTYGISGDAHMSKNTEWGAVSYLSHSKYGINQEIRINNNSSYKTGCGANTDSAAASSTCDITYGQASSYPQSTTGNITGVFDMSGGAWEYQMSVLADDTGKPRSGYTAVSYTIEQARDILGRTDGVAIEIRNSGYNGLTYGKNPNGDGSLMYVTNGKNFPDFKYYDLYKATNWATACNGQKCLGEALTETSKWYQDGNTFVSSLYPWILRGGYIYNSAGGFNFSCDYGYPNIRYSFRMIVN